MLDADPGGEQRRLAERTQRRHQVGIVVDLGGARHAQRLAGRRHQGDQADLARGQDIAEAEGQVVAGALGDQQGPGILDPYETRIVALRRHLDRAIGRRRADQGERTAGQEGDRLLVEGVQDLGARRRTRFGENAPKIVGRGDACHGPKLPLCRLGRPVERTIDWLAPKFNHVGDGASSRRPCWRRVAATMP